MTPAPQVEPVSKKKVLEKAEAQEHRCRLRLPPKAPLSFVLGSTSKRKSNSGGSEAAAQQTPEPKKRLLDPGEKAWFPGATAKLATVQQPAVSALLQI